MQRSSGKEEIPTTRLAFCRQQQSGIEEGKKGAINNSRTRAPKATAEEEYTEANRAVMNSVKTDKENFIEKLAKEAEDASAQGHMIQLYDITRILAGNYKHTYIQAHE